MEVGQDIPIVAVCIISDPTKLPPYYTLIDKSHDKSDDADLWKDGLWGRRVMRYLCVKRQIPTASEDVLVDVTLINERDDPPPGFTVLESTNDSGEKATKKRLICLRWMVPSMTTDAITELVFVNRTQRRAPAGYTMVGDINNLSLCYKMDKVASPDPSNQTGGGAAMPYGMPQSQTSTSLPYAPPVPARPAPNPTLSVNTSLTPSHGQQQHNGALSPASNLTALSGVQWKLNSRYNLMMELRNLTLPEIRGKSLSEIEEQYAYTFELERTVSKSHAVS